MSADDYAAMSTERLLGLFVETAKATGSIYSEFSKPASSGLPEKIKPTPERERRIAELRALGAALAARKPIAEVRRLFEDDDPDVRAWAGGLFLAIDTRWAFATMQGLLTGLSTREVLALMQRLEQEPPSRPTLQEMSDDALVARFEDAATREYATRFLDCVDDQRDIDARNRILGEVWDVMRELKARGALGRLLPLLASPNVTVRREAATACLRVAEQEAAAVLEDIAAHAGSDDKYAAREALDHWRKKAMVVYGV